MPFRWVGKERERGSERVKRSFEFYVNEKEMSG